MLLSLLYINNASKLQTFLPHFPDNMIYLDNSATTKQHDRVTELMVKFMRQDFGNPSALYGLGVDAEKAIKTARRQVEAAAFMGRDASGNRSSGKGSSVVFTSGGTEADNMAIFGAAKAMKRMGRRIVTTEVEHPAVLECCNALEREGFEIVRVGVDGNCRPDMKQFENAINEDTVLVTMMHVNNEAGTVMPVSSVREILKKKNAPAVFHCDGVQSFGKMPLPGEADMISVSGHKIHGPKGSGALIINSAANMENSAGRAGRSLNIPAFILGGGQEAGKRSGTENVPAIAGLGLAAEMSRMAYPQSAEEMTRLRQMLVEGIKDNISDAIINSPLEAGTNAGQCCPSVLNVSFLGTRGEVLLHTLEQYGIYVSTGSACSSNKKGRSHVLKAMGLKDKEIEGTIRFSLGRFNTEEDIEETIEKVTEAVKRFRKLGSFR